MDVRDVLYAVLYVRVSCFVVRRCAVSRRYINVCNWDMFSVVYVYHDHLKFCVVCIDGRRYVCCSKTPIYTGTETDTHAHCIPGRVAGRNDLSYIVNSGENSF